MTPRPKALDIMYYVATPEFIGKWTDAKKGELICRMKRAIGSLPQFASIPAMLGKMDEAGVEKVFILDRNCGEKFNSFDCFSICPNSTSRPAEKYPDRF